MYCFICLGPLSWRILYNTVGCVRCDSHVMTMEYLWNYELDHSSLRKLLDSLPVGR